MPGLSPTRGLGFDDAAYTRVLIQTAIPFILAGGTYYSTINTAVNQILDLQLRIFDTVSNFFIAEALAVEIEFGA